MVFISLKERYLKSLQKVNLNNEEDEDNSVEEEFSAYLKDETTTNDLNPNNFFKNSEDGFEDVGEEVLRKEE